MNERMHLTAARLRSALLSLCAAAALTACGAASPSATYPPIPPARALATAQAINLTAADVPGYQPLAPTQIAWNPQTGPSTRCLRIANIIPMATSTSSEYSSQSGLSGGRLSSLTSTYQSPAAARQVLAALQAQRAPQCLERSILTHLAPAAAESHLKLEPAVQITPLPNTVTGTPDTFAYRMALTAQPHSVSQQQFTVYTDLYGEVTGPTLTELATYSNGRLIPASTEQHLVNLLAHRARTILPTGA
jgi:hypothetical protein